MSRRQKAAQSAKAGPEAILPLTDFRGDPWGTGDENAVAFRAGVLSSPVPAEFATKVSSEGKAARIGPATSDPAEIAARQAALKVTVTNLDGSPVARDADGTIRGEPLNITDEQRAALPALDPNAVDDPTTYAYGTSDKT